MDSLPPNKSFDKVLKIAAKGDLGGVRSILKEYPEVLNKASEGHHRTLLWEAVNKNRRELVEYLVDQGADVNIPGRYRSQTFVLLKPYCIAHKNKKEGLKDYLFINGHEMDIHSLAYLGRNEDLTQKIHTDQKQINLAQKEDKIWEVTPLHFAVSGKHISTTELLLEAGAEVSNYSRLLYEIACRNNSMDTIKLLTKFGGDPKAIDVPNVFYTNNKEIIEYFVHKGLDCDKLLGKGWPPIVYVCRGDKGEHPEKVELLSEYVRNLNAQTPKGVSAMHAASKAGFLDVIKVLLANGAEINIRDKKGKTALAYSRKYKRKAVEEFLMSIGGRE